MKCNFYSAFMCSWFLLINSLKYIEDKNGYILYCPCMGRFGNQADQFLGVFNFAISLNRTLVLPPWIEYEPFNAKPKFTPFADYIQIQPLSLYHKVVTMEDFFKYLAKDVWILEKRFAFCYAPRSFAEHSLHKDCNAKEGSPFGPFWDNFNVNFTTSQFYGPLPLADDKVLNHNTPNHIKPYHGDISNLKLMWDSRYPVSEYSVLAFTGAPSSFPVKTHLRWLQKFLVWSEIIARKANKYFYDQYKIQEYDYIGIHLRNGIDWKRTCEHVGQVDQLFSSPQCLGDSNENGQLTYEMCFPNKSTIISHVRQLVKQTNIKNVYVASDKNHMIKDLQENLGYLGAKIYVLGSDDSQVDLYILARAKEFIGNCVSSFTAFVKRERDVANLSSSFWAFIPNTSTNPHGNRQEL